MRMKAYVHLLAASKSLATLVIVRPPSQLGDGDSAQMDLLTGNPRFVMTELDRYTVDWQQGILVGCDCWTRADGFIAQRGSDEIERASPGRVLLVTCDLIGAIYSSMSQVLLEDTS
jgi:hypothetical protein